MSDHHVRWPRAFEIDPEEFEDSSRRPVRQVVLRYWGHVVAFEHVPVGDPVTVGEEPGCTIICSKDALERPEVELEIREVPPGRPVARHGGIDRPFWFCNAISAALLLTLLWLSMMIPREPLAIAAAAETVEPRYVGYASAPPQTRIVRVEPAALDSSALPREPQARARELYRSGPQSAIPPMVPVLKRDADPIADARSLGILGVLQHSSGNLLASPYGLGPGLDDSEVWTQPRQLGSSFGQLGDSLTTEFARAGVASGSALHIEVGTVHTPGAGAATGFDERGTIVPRFRCGGKGGGCKPRVRGALGVSIIRRTVRAHHGEVRHCYNRALTRDPNTRGRVEITFLIAPDGRVTKSIVSSNGTADARLGECIAAASRRWRFPTAGGSSRVTYPFSLSVG